MTAARRILSAPRSPPTLLASEEVIFSWVLRVRQREREKERKRERERSKHSKPELNIRIPCSPLLDIGGLAGVLGYLSESSLSSVSLEECFNKEVSLFESREREREREREKREE